MTESSRGSDESLGRALELARAALAQRPAGILSDFDGTLSPIVEDPTAARLAEGAQAALETLASRLAVVAVVTGRAAADARRMTGVDELLVVGNHGIEWLEPGQRTSRGRGGVERVAAALRSALAAVPELPGVDVEDKRLSATVHYRRATNPSDARRTLLAALRPVTGEVFDLREGRRSVELRPRGAGDKGTAARSVIERYGLRGAVVLGDDATDVDMFRAAIALRSEGRLAAAIIGVGAGVDEIPAEVTRLADVMLPDPAQVAALLVALSDSS